MPSDGVHTGYYHVESYGKHNQSDYPQCFTEKLKRLPKVGDAPLRVRLLMACT